MRDIAQRGQAERACRRAALLVPLRMSMKSASPSRPRLHTSWSMCPTRAPTNSVSARCASDAIPWSSGARANAPRSARSRQSRRAPAVRSERPHRAERVVGPGARPPQVGGCPFDRRRATGVAAQDDPVVGAWCDRDRGAQRDDRREHEAVVVVGVLADGIHAPRRGFAGSSQVRVAAVTDATRPPGSPVRRPRVMPGGPSVAPRSGSPYPSRRSSRPCCPPVPRRGRAR